MKKKFIALGILLGIGFSINAQSLPKQLKTITVNGVQFVDLNGNGELDIFEDTRVPMDQRINNILSKLTLEEKAKLAIGTGMEGIQDLESIQPVIGETNKIVPGAAGTTTAIERLGIPSVVLADGPAGLRINPNRPNDNNTYYCTGFPVGTVLATTWNKNLVEEVGKAMGEETLEYGADVLLAPALNIHRNPLCGRNFEYYSEDPLLSGKIAAAIVNGVQSNGVGASVKHFAANNSESNRMEVNSHISQRALREIYLRGFEIVIKESNPWTVMSAYNKINGVYASADRALLTDILRTEWGYKGLVMTDWYGGFTGLAALFGTNTNSNTIKQLYAGNDLLMPGTNIQEKDIISGVKSGLLKEADLDVNIKRILELILISPKANNYNYSNRPNLNAHGAITRQAGSEGMILLRNENNTLPINPIGNKIAAFGVGSYNFIAGGKGSGDVHKAYVVSLMEGLQNGGYTLDEELKILYIPHVEKEKAKFGKLTGLAALLELGIIPELTLKESLINKKAKENDAAIITISRNSTETADRLVDNDFNLTTEESKLIAEVSKAFRAQNKKVIVVLNIGGVIETTSWRDQADAILLAWQSGQEGGNSVTDVLCGKINPSGKLPMTFPMKYADTPSAKNFPGTPAEKPTDISYEEGVYVGYRYFNTFGVKPAYEFGYGLSYSQFEFSNLKLSNKEFNNELFIAVDVKNTGKVAGKEVIQVYLSAPNGNIDKPKSELKAFEKTRLLQPGESQTIMLRITTKDLASFCEKSSAWIAEKGVYTLKIGSSSLNIKLEESFNLATNKLIEKVNNVMRNDIQFSDLKH